MTTLPTTPHDDPHDPAYLHWVGQLAPKRRRPGCGNRLYGREVADVCPDVAGGRP